jgi:PAS domain S-box-containing protein
MDHHSDRELRKRAEAHIRQKNPGTSGNITLESDADIARVVHEMRVHQFELEMQNDELQKVHAELDAAWSRYFDLYENAPIGYLSLDSAGMIADANRTAASLLGETRHRLVNHQVTRFIFIEDQDVFYKFHHRLMHSSDHHEAELRMLKNNGTLIWMRLDGVAAVSADGTPGCRIMLTNITARRHADEQTRANLNELRAIFQGAMDGICITDRGGHVLDVNEAYCAMSGYSREELLAKDVTEIDESAAVAEFETLAQRIIGTGGARFDRAHRRKDGSTYDVEVSMQYQPVGGGRFVLFLRKSTEGMTGTPAPRE